MSVRVHHLENHAVLLRFQEKPHTYSICINCLDPGRLYSAPSDPCWDPNIPLNVPLLEHFPSYDQDKPY